jgi:hypothetical protein
LAACTVFIVSRMEQHRSSLVTFAAFNLGLLMIGSMRSSGWTCTQDDIAKGQESALRTGFFYLIIGSNAPLFSNVSQQIGRSHVLEKISFCVGFYLVLSVRPD